MRIVFLFFAVVFVAIAEDVFFFDTHGNEFVHRLSQACYIAILSEDQIDNIHNHTYALELQEQVRENQQDPARLTRLNQDDASDFVTHHCHNRQLYLVAL